MFSVSRGFRWPLLQGILPLDRSRLVPDMMAGITLAALGIPEVMGYTKIIGTPVITGLYTMLLPVLVFAIFGSSRHLVVSADSATAAMVAAALTALSFTAYSPEYVVLTSLIGLVAAALLLAARLFRLGFLADFLSRTVLVGFLSGVGIQVAFGEIHAMLGIEKGGHGFAQNLLFTFQHLSQTHLPNLYISLAVLAIIVGSARLAPRFPGALLAVIGMIGASWFFNWADNGIAVVGAVPSGLPHLGLPGFSWADVKMVLPISVSCCIVILAQSAATSQAYALRYRDQFNQNLDLVGLSLANLAAGCSGTFVVNGSPTKTAMVDTGGGQSQVSHLSAALMVLIVLLFLTGPLGFLPNAVLAAIVFMVGIHLLDLRGLADIYRKQPREFVVAIVTAATVILIGVKEGILLAMVLSLLQQVRRSYRPHTAVILRDPADQWHMEEAEPGKMIVPGMVMYWFGAALFYANASHFAEEVRRLVAESPSPVRWLVVDCSGISSVDYSAGRMAVELHQDLAKQGVVFALARINRRSEGDLERLGLVDVFGEKRIFESRHQCLVAYEAEEQQKQNSKH